MKRILSLILALTMCTTLCIPAFAANEPTVSLEATDALTKYTLTMPIDAQKDSSNFETLAAENLEKAVSYIESLPFTDSKKEQYIRRITEEAANGVLEGIVIYDYDSKASRGSEDDYAYYGTYGGRTFYTRPYMDLIIEYKKETQRNLSVLGAWFSLALDLICEIKNTNTTAQVVNISFNALDYANTLLQSGYTPQVGEYAEYYIKTIKNVRDIVTLDDMNYVGTPYCTLIQDAKMTLYPYVIYHGNTQVSGHSAIVYENPADRITLYSQYYNSPNYNLQQAYNRYNTYPGSPLLWTAVAFTDENVTWSWG